MKTRHANLKWLAKFYLQLTVTIVQLGHYDSLWLTASKEYLSDHLTDISIFICNNILIFEEFTLTSFQALKFLSILERLKD